MAIRFSSIYGVDFSGAKAAGRNIWIAHARPPRAGRLRLASLDRLEDLAGKADRSAALDHLVRLIRASDAALWGIDFPFGLPVEVMDAGFTWPDQIRLLQSWPDEAYALGLWCIERARQLGDRMHIRRATDFECKAPFDCYHYRIIYQTFHGMRDVLGPLSRTRGTAILPFQANRLPTARRVVCESCPASTLKRLGLPHQNYKQPAGGPLTLKRRKTRHAILAELGRSIDIGDADRRTIMRNGGGDALDAVIAAAGVWDAWRSADHDRIRRHARYRREGYVYS